MDTDDDFFPHFPNRNIAWAPGGERFATFGHYDNPRVGLWVPGVWKEAVWLEGHEQDVGCAAFSPDGRWLVSGSRDQTVRVWDTSTGTPLAALRGHEGDVTCVAFSPDGGRVVSGATDRTVRVWDVNREAELACLRIEDPGVWGRGWSSDGGSWEVHAVREVAFAADGHTVLTLSDPDRIRFWDPATGTCVRAVQGLAELRAVAAGAPWQAFLRGGLLEVEDGRSRAVVARAPYPRSLLPAQAPVPRPDHRAWAGSVGRHLFLHALLGGEVRADSVDRVVIPE